MLYLLTLLVLLTVYSHYTLMAKLTELAGRLTGIETVLNKVKTEVEALRAALENVDLPADAEAALGRLEAIAKTIDELNPDAPTP